METRERILDAALVSFADRGYEATSLDALEIPAEVLSQANLQLEVGVTHYKPPGAAWAQLVIIVVYLTPEGVAI